jgi:hypothetical protein
LPRQISAPAGSRHPALRFSEVDLYSTVARSLGIADKFGDPRFFTDYLGEIL